VTGDAGAAGPVAEAMLARRSQSSVTDEAPTRKQLKAALRAAANVADHSGLRPWRVIELRGDARRRLGESLAKAEGASDAGKHVRKAMRAPVVLAIVCSPRSSRKVPYWEQEAVASGVAHALSLVLDEAGWGVFWRTGSETRAKAVAKAHGLERHERMLGWLYVGGKPERRSRRRKPIRLKDHFSSL
jgi:nitroreductase